jgi:alpha-beta hydrolase superfamily lysophospholipase
MLLELQPNFKLVVFLCVPFPATSLTTIPAGAAKGVVVLCQGYTACPDAMKDIAADLNKAGYITYIPLVVGMGLSKSYQCPLTPNVCVGKHPDNPSEMPTTKEGYMNWAKSSLGWITADVAKIPAASKAAGFSWSAMGLSLGGPMAMYAAQMPGNPFSKSIDY